MDIQVEVLGNITYRIHGKDFFIRYNRKLALHQNPLALWGASFREVLSAARSLLHSQYKYDRSRCINTDRTEIDPAHVE